MRHRAILIAALMLIATLMSSCKWGGIKGTVVDAESGVPIEDAAVVITWIWSGGLGPGSMQIRETTTDKNGLFVFTRDKKATSTPRHLVIYKYGYKSWTNKGVFDNNIMIGAEHPIFEWRSGQTYKMEKFPEGWSHLNHVRFIRDSLGHVYSPLWFEKAQKELREGDREWDRLDEEKKQMRKKNVEKR